jgi:ABC-type histidine transport system ATPase subunit
MQLSCGRCVVLRHNLHNAERWVNDLAATSDGDEGRLLRHWREQANRLRAELAIAEAAFDLWLEKGDPA